MNTLARRIATLVAALALAATAAGCANTPTATPTANTADSQAALDALNNASEITATARPHVTVSNIVIVAEQHITIEGKQRTSGNLAQLRFNDATAGEMSSCESYQQPFFFLFPYMPRLSGGIPPDTIYYTTCGA